MKHSQQISSNPGDELPGDDDEITAPTPTSWSDENDISLEETEVIEQDDLSAKHRPAPRPLMDLGFLFRIQK